MRNIRSAEPGVGIQASGEAFADCLDVPGWDDWSIGIHVRVVSGRARVVGIQGITYTGTGDAPPLTAKRLESIPLQAMADYLIRGTDFRLHDKDELRELRQRIASADNSGHTDSRSVITVREVAEAWLDAHFDPKVTNINETVADRLHISVRTVANKANEAEQAGLIPSEYRRTQTTDRKRGSGNEKKESTT